MDTQHQSDIFKFVSLRPAVLTDYKKDDRRYIKDEYLHIEGTTREKLPRDLLTASSIGSMVLTKVAQGTDVPTIVSDIINYYTSVGENINNPAIETATDIVEKHLVDFNKIILVKDLEETLQTDLKTFAIKTEANTISPFEEKLAYLFDQLYVLYILKRKQEINLEFVMNALKTMHVIEALANTELITTRQELAIYFDAVPVINPIFAFLRNTPFNDIKPIGVGDLKVVKQWLVLYRAGEVAHIENVLKGESKKRTHRRLDRREDILSLQTEKAEETERETQTTDRFELKQEVDSTMQQDINMELGTAVSAKYWDGRI